MSISHDAESGLGYVNKQNSRDEGSRVGRVGTQGRVPLFGHGLSIADCCFSSEFAT